MRNRREIGDDIVDVLLRMATMWKNTEGRSDNAVQTFATSFEPATPRRTQSDLAVQLATVCCVA